MRLGYFRKAKDNSHIPASDVIVELCRNEKSKVTSAFLVTKRIEDFEVPKQETIILVMRIPAIAFLYFLGKAMAEGQGGKI